MKGATFAMTTAPARAAKSEAVLSGLLVLGLAAAVAAAAAAATLTGPLSDAGWKLYLLDRVPPARVISHDGRTIEVSSDGGFALLYRPVTAADGGAEMLTWRWRVDAAPPPADLAVKGVDDRPLAIHVWFPDPDPGPFAWLRGSVGSALLGVPDPGRALTYVWGGQREAETVIANPHLKGGVIKILQPGSAPLGEWRSETVDIRGDFRDIFGVPAPRPAWLALSVDTDDRGGISRGVVADLAFGDRDG